MQERHAIKRDGEMERQIHTRRFLAFLLRASFLSEDGIVPGAAAARPLVCASTSVDVLVTGKAADGGGSAGVVTAGGAMGPCVTEGARGAGALALTLAVTTVLSPGSESNSIEADSVGSSLELIFEAGFSAATSGCAVGATGVWLLPEFADLLCKC